MSAHNIYTFQFAEMYSLYVAKAERKGRTSAEVNEIICWLTGYNLTQIEKMLNEEHTLESFFKNTPSPSPKRTLITGSICGVKISEITEPIMKEIRYLDKLIDELAKGKAMEKILRQ